MLNDLQKRFSPLKAAIIVGVAWGFWHTPLWLLSGYSGLQLVQYIICFLSAVVAISKCFIQIITSQEILKTEVGQQDK